MISLCLNGFNGSPFYGGPADLPAWVDAAAHAGFPFFAPDRWSIDAYIAGGGTVEKLARRMRDAQIGCGFIGAAAMLGSDGDLIADMRMALRAAQTLDAHFIQINVNMPDGPARYTALENACNVTEGSGVRIAIEYMPFMALRSVTETAALALHAGYDKAGAMIDIWHHMRGPDRWADLEAVDLAAVAYVEFNDAPPMLGDDIVRETMERRVFPGEGEFDAARFAETFKSRGYDGMVSVEVLNGEWRRRDLRDYATRAFESSAPYWL